MRIALISDIHGNLPALRAVLQAIRRHAPDAIYALGDQVNLGPNPREVLALLREDHVACLHGNHERYLLSAMAGDPAYDGANFNALRFGIQQLTAEDITFPKEARIGCALLTHAMPGDDRFPVFDIPKAMEKLRGMDFPSPTHILCGHGHNPTHIRFGHLTLDSIGSVGCMDDGVPGTAPFVIADIGEDYVGLRPYYTHYDVREMPRRFRESGMADFCPVMAHIICWQMMHNVDIICPFVGLAQALSREKGEPRISEATWLEADARFDWPSGLRTAAFWRTIE